MLVTVGAGFVTVKALGNVADCPLVFVTTTFHSPAEVADGAGSGSVQVMIFDDESTVTDVAVILDDPAFVRLTVVLGRKPVPARFVIVTDVPATPVPGVMPVTVRGVIVYVNSSADEVALIPPGVVTVILTVPAAPAGDVMVI